MRIAFGDFLDDSKILGNNIFRCPDLKLVFKPKFQNLVGCPAQNIPEIKRFVSRTILILAMTRLFNNCRKVRFFEALLFDNFSALRNELVESIHSRLFNRLEQNILAIGHDE